VSDQPGWKVAALLVIHRHRCRRRTQRRAQGNRYRYGLDTLDAL